METLSRGSLFREVWEGLDGELVHVLGQIGGCEMNVSLGHLGGLVP